MWAKTGFMLWIFTLLEKVLAVSGGMGVVYHCLGFRVKIWKVLQPSSLALSGAWWIEP